MNIDPNFRRVSLIGAVAEALVDLLRDHEHGELIAQGFAAGEVQLLISRQGIEVVRDGGPAGSGSN